MKSVLKVEKLCFIIIIHKRVNVLISDVGVYFLPGPCSLGFKLHTQSR